MEPHRELTAIEGYKPDLTDPKVYFQKAHTFAKTFYGEDVKRMESVEFKDVTPSFFFEEYVWVVCATGFSAKAVSKFVGRLITELGWFDELAKEEFDVVFNRTKSVLNNKDKAKDYV